MSDPLSSKTKLSLRGLRASGSLGSTAADEIERLTAEHLANNDKWIELHGKVKAERDRLAAFARRVASTFDDSYRVGSLERSLGNAAVEALAGVTDETTAPRRG